MGIINKMSRFVGPMILPKVSYQKRIIDTYTKLYKSEQVAKNTVLYESRDGKSLTDSPFAIFEYLLKTDQEQKYTHIWVVTKSQELAKIQAKYQEQINVLFVVRNSDDYLKWLAKAEYLINNSTFQPFVTIKKEQTYINTWHGTPLKTMGFDIPGNPANAKNVVRNFFMADYLISPNPHTTRMFTESFRLNQNYPGKIIEDGYPRIDQTFTEDKTELYTLLAEFDVNIDQNKKILLYTPTCKEGNLAMSTEQVAQIHQEMAVVRAKFDQEYNVLIKVHPFLYSQASAFNEIKPFLIPDVIDTNKLLGIVDCLITDYSSIFFDFLVTDKPILFYCWDDDLYGNERGKYIEYDELPGPVSFSVEELIQSIENLPKDRANYQDKYETFKQKYTLYDDGKVTERLVDLVFNNQKDLNMKVLQGSTHKERLLIYPGGMRSNGITSSFLNLLASIDYSKYEVVCFLDNIKTADQITNVAGIPKNVSMLFRFEAPNYTVKENYQNLMVHLKGVKKGKEDKYPQEIYEREAARLIGNQEFDVAIDFSGYSLNWSKMVLAVQAKKYNCFLHSDMKLDQQRVVDGKKPHFINLQGIFSVYNRYDKLVSVSEVICQINQEKLADYAPKEKFVYATNTINPAKILGNQKQAEIISKKETTRLFRDGIIKNLEKNQMIRTSRPDTPFGSTLTKKFTSDKILVLGSFEFENVTYYKVVQNNVYLGWMDSQEITVEPVKVTSQKTVSYFGKINTTSKDSLYSEPIGLADSIPVSSAGDLKNLYAEFKEEVTTQETTSLKLVIRGTTLGYLDKSKVTFSKKLNWTKEQALPIKQRVLRKAITPLNYGLHKTVLKEIAYQPIKKELINAYYQNQDNRELLAYPKPNAATEVISLGKMTYIYIISLATTSEDTFYEIQMPNQEIYWLKKSNSNLIPLTSEKIVLEKEISEKVTLLTNEVTVYATAEECLTNQGTLVSLKEKTLQITKQLKTSAEQRFVLALIGHKELWLNTEHIAFIEKEGISNAEGLFFPFPDKEQLSIVTTGRLSQEKNQVVLIEAFAKFLLVHPKSILYIIGSGPEEANLKIKIKELSLEDAVVLMGQIYNPFVFMKECNIFALTSLYEGQSIVLLEALTLGMTCVSTDIPACRKVLGDGDYGMLTGTNDSSGVCLALETVMKNNTKFKTFDAYEYNETSVNLFYKTL